VNVLNHLNGLNLHTLGIWQGTPVFFISSS